MSSRRARIARTALRAAIQPPAPSAAACSTRPSAGPLCSQSATNAAPRQIPEATVESSSGSRHQTTARAARLVSAGVIPSAADGRQNRLGSDGGRIALDAEGPLQQVHLPGRHAGQGAEPPFDRPHLVLAVHLRDAHHHHVGGRARDQRPVSRSDPPHPPRGPDPSSRRRTRHGGSPRRSSPRRSGPQAGGSRRARPRRHIPGSRGPRAEGWHGETDSSRPGRLPSRAPPGPRGRGSPDRTSA